MQRSIEIGVLADDLTGCLDCLVAFQQIGMPSMALLDSKIKVPENVQALGLSSESRDLKFADEASAVTLVAAARLAKRNPRIWYKKIDSLLRGWFAHEIVAISAIMCPDIVLLSPALPTMGRVVVNGHSVIVETKSQWNLPHETRVGNPDTDLISILRNIGLRVALLGLKDIRSGMALAWYEELKSDVDVIVCDAETDTDLAAVAAAGLASRLRILWVGSAGLARAIALECCERKGYPNKLKPFTGVFARGPVAIVVGSMAGKSRDQTEVLRRTPGVAMIDIDPDTIRVEYEESVHSNGSVLERYLQRKADVCFAIMQSKEDASEWGHRRRIEKALGEIIGPRNRGIGGFILTGGATARSVLNSCGVVALGVCGVIEDGVPVSVTYPDGRPVVTKAGTFGNRETLLRSLRVIRGKMVKDLKGGV